MKIKVTKSYNKIYKNNRRRHKIADPRTVFRVKSLTETDI